MPPNKRLVAILTNPPESTDGLRTKRRVDQARRILGYEDSQIANIFPIASYRSGEIAVLGLDADPWLRARPTLQEHLEAADAVLLAYGLGEPVGSARQWHRNQIEWLQQQLFGLRLPVFVVGDGPRHPSRWHRYTHRQHPNVPFECALARSIREIRIHQDPETALDGP